MVPPLGKRILTKNMVSEEETSVFKETQPHAELCCSTVTPGYERRGAITATNFCSTATLGGTPHNTKFGCLLHLNNSVTHEVFA